jgi:hypothetical protein
MKTDLQEQVPQWLSLKEKYRLIVEASVAHMTRSRQTPFTSAAIVASSSVRTICARIVAITTGVKSSSPKGSNTPLSEITA